MKIDSKILSYVGFGLLVLALIVPYAKIPMLGGLGLVFNMGSLGEVSGFSYVISIVAIAVTAYAGYVVFAKPADYMKAAIAAAAAFLIMFIGFYIIRGAVKAEAGMFSDFVSMAFRMGLATWLFLLGAAAFYFSSRGFSPIELGGTPEAKKEEE